MLDRIKELGGQLTTMEFVLRPDTRVLHVPRSPDPGAAPPPMVQLTVRPAVEPKDSTLGTAGGQATP